ALYSVFTWTMLSRRQATTIADAQAAIDINVTLALVIYIVLVQFYAVLGNRRDHRFRILIVGVLVVLAIVNQWLPLRGTVIAPQRVELPIGGTELIPIRTAPGLPLA